MTHELRLLALSALLAFVQILLAAGTTTAQRPGGLGWAAGPRDTPQPPPRGTAARLTRARDNMLETFPIFAAAILAAHLAGANGALTGWGAMIYFWGRVLYVPAYLSEVPFLRTAVWAASIVGMLMVLAAVLFG